MLVSFDLEYRDKFYIWYQMRLRTNDRVFSTSLLPLLPLMKTLTAMLTICVLIWTYTPPLCRGRAKIKNAWAKIYESLLKIPLLYLGWFHSCKQPQFKKMVLINIQFTLLFYLYRGYLFQGILQGDGTSLSACTSAHMTYPINCLLNIHIKCNLINLSQKEENGTKKE